jgi:hypothetical protein
VQIPAAVVHARAAVARIPGDPASISPGRGRDPPRLAAIEPPDARSPRIDLLSDGIEAFSAPPCTAAGRDADRVR